MNYNYGDNYPGDESEFRFQSPRPDDEQSAAEGKAESAEHAEPAAFPAYTVPAEPAVPADARPYVGSAHTYNTDGKQHGAWSEAEYRAVPERSANVYTPGLTDPVQYTRHRYVPPANGRTATETYGRRRGGFLRAACLAVVCVMLSAAAAYAVVEYKYIPNDSPPTAPTVILGSQQPASSQPENTRPIVSPGDELPPEMIYDIALSQVVVVRTEATASTYEGSSTVTVSSGSGFIISNDGYILTNYHVVEDASNRGFSVVVLLNDGVSYNAVIVGFEQENDVAVLKIEADGLNAVAMGDSDSIRVGNVVYAVGDPLGHLDYTMTDGIVSALDRVIAVDTQTSINMFQITAAVNSGNSGGPVYDSKGEVIGIVSAKYKDIGVEGLGFAIPINDAVQIAEQLITNGYVTGKAFLGIEAQTIDSATAEFYNVVEGAWVSSVEPGSCAEKAGMKQGDIIIKLGDMDVTSRDTLLLAKRKYKADDTTEMVVFRAGEMLTLTVTFDKEPEPELQQQELQPEPGQGGGGQGFLFPW